MQTKTFARIMSLIAIFCSSASAEPVKVSDVAALRDALRDPKPGTRILLAPGEYGQVSFSGLRGTSEAPIIIEAQDPQNPPVFGNASGGIHLGRVEHVVLRNLEVRKGRRNGINIDDGGNVTQPSHHVLLENIRVSDIGPTGNVDGIKLSGLDDFIVRACTVEGWGGSAIDMVGCHRGVIERSRFVGKDGFAQSNGVQTKGGSSQVAVRDCVFVNAGQRAVNIGGSTGMPYFRPAGAKYEAREITVEGCRFIGSAAPINFVGVDGAVVRYNTIYNPTRWVIRILQETRDPAFAPSRNGRFENNIVVFETGKVSSIVSTGPGTEPATFTFAGNHWYASDAPQRSRPQLPSTDQEGVHGENPHVEMTNGDLVAKQGLKVGAGAWRR